jgi:hypothetical protein
MAQAVPPADNSRRWSVRGAFVTFPAGDLSIDPSGAFTDIPAGRLKSVTQPYLYGGEAGATYTRRFGRWLPAKIAAVSPDSSHYAYSEFTEGPSRHSKIHVVEVNSGVDRVVYDKDFYMVREYSTDGLYLVNVGPTGEGATGLWLLDPRSGSIREVAPTRLGGPFGFYLVGRGGAWYGDVAPGDQPPFLGIGPMDRVLRFDLKTGKSTPWFRRVGRQVEAIGFDGEGHLVVRVYLPSGVDLPSGGSASASEELWLVTAPGIATQIYFSSGASSPGFSSAPLSDSHGLWFGTSQGIFLYTLDRSFQMVSSVGGEIAGRCS